MISTTGIIPRINAIIDYSGFNKKDFAEKIGITPSNLSAILLGKRTCGQGVLNKIQLSFEQINSSWLLTGEGSMLKEFHGSPPTGDVPSADCKSAEKTNVKEQKNIIIGDKDMKSDIEEVIKRCVVESISCVVKDVVVPYVDSVVNSMEQKMRMHEQRNVEMKRDIMEMMDKSERRMDGMMNRATELISNSMQATTAMVSQNGDMRNLYQNLYDEKNGHIERSKQYLDDSAKNILLLRDDLKEVCSDLKTSIGRMLDKQTAETTELYISGREEVIEKCKTAVFVPMKGEA